MEQLLPKFKNINPNKEFAKRSLAIILNSPQKNDSLFYYYLSPILNLRTFALGAAIFFVISGLALFNQRANRSSLLANFDQKKLDEELKQFDIQIQLPQAEYYERSAKEIEVALNKTSDEFQKE